MSTNEFEGRPCSLCYEVEASYNGYCRECWNTYQRWRYQRRRDGAPSTIKDYRIMTNRPVRDTADLVTVDPTEEGERLKECPICLSPHRNPHSRSYCPPCKSAYSQWSRKKRAQGRNPTMEEFRFLCERGLIVPRREGELHQGRVVRGL